MANNHIKVFKADSEEYKKLEKAAQLMNILHEEEGRHFVRETYFDFGQDWKWTTIICDKPGSEWGGYQALCPRDQELILAATNGDEILAAVQGVFERRKEWRH